MLKQKWTRKVAISATIFLSLALTGCIPAEQGEKASQQEPPVGQSEVVASKEAESKEPLRIMTWNVENMFDAIDDPYYDEIMTEEEVDEKLSKLAEVIHKKDPDIVGLQEVEKLSLLRHFTEDYLKDYPYVALIEGNNTRRGIDVALISRFPITKTVSHKGMPLGKNKESGSQYRFSRDCLEAHIDWEGQDLVFLVNHFKSKHGGRSSELKRRAQAGGVAKIVKDLKSKGFKEIVVMGDLNDFPDSFALEPLTEHPSLVDMSYKIPTEDRYTYIYKKRYYNVLDYIFLSPTLEKRYVDNSYQVGRGTSVIEGSDHFPILLELK